jgi:hypothetical protein
MNRQTERRKLFQFAMAQMPLWETWTTEREVLPEGFTAAEAVPTIVKRNHVKMIPRRVRRSMARDLAKRRWEVR